MAVRGLTEGAILATLVALLALATRYIPVIQFVSALLCPLPLTFLVIRQGARVAVLAAFVAAGVGAMTGGPLTAVAIVVTFAPLGIALGLGVRNRWAPATIVVVTAVVATVSLCANLALTFAIAGVNPYSVMIEGMQRGQEQSLRLYQRLGIDPRALEQASGMIKQWLEIMPKLIPMLIVGGGAFAALINFHIGRLVLRRFGITVAGLPPVTTWRTHPLILWMLPVGFMLLILGQRYEVAQTAGLNISFFAQSFMLLQGLLVAWVFFDRYSSPNWLRGVIIAVAVMQPILNVAILVLGLADAAFDLRGRWRVPREATS